MKMLLKRSGKLRDDAGAAMVIVVGSMVVLMVLVLGVLAYTMQSAKFSRYDQDYTSAMAAAQAGVDDYISRLNRADNYHMNVDCDNEALKGPMSVSNSCGYDSEADAGWLPVTPGDSVDSAPSFHYAVDSSTVFTEGTVNLSVTGRSRDVFRSIEVAVGKGGSTDFVYYTDFESADPANKISYSNGAPNDSCGRSGNSLAKYFWQGRSYCTEITFINTDTLDGRVFSNDAILSSGATFEQGIESANPGCHSVTGNENTWRNCLRSGSNANFGVRPKYSEALYLPDTSAEFEDHPGCHYYGATRIVFKDNGKMRVWSKDSDFSGAVLSVAGPDGAPYCGTGSSLASENGELIDVPTEMVIYVAGAPEDVQRRQLFGGEIGGANSGDRLPLGNFSEPNLEAPTGYGQSYTFDRNMDDPVRHRGEGNAYVEGTLKGRVTVAAAQSVIATGDVVLSEGTNGSDMLGLVATNSVEVMHPRMATRNATGNGNNRKWGNPTNERESNQHPYNAGVWPKRIPDPATGNLNPSSGIQIAGSLQTLQHSFFVQQYNKGPNNGTLLVTGSIAQRWRGAVGTGSGYNMTGYSKLYQYDQRLRYSAPPYFPHWANSEWSLRYSGEMQTPSNVKS